MILEVHRHTLDEGLLADHVAQHLEDTSTLGVGDGVKDLLNRVLVGALHLDGVGGAERVEREGAAKVLADEGGVNLPRGLDLLSREEYVRILQAESSAVSCSPPES